MGSQPEGMIAPRQPRLDSDAGSSHLPPTAYHPSTMLASTELGVYVKWALLLQEQLEQVQGERVAMMQRCLKLEAENDWCKAALYEENPQNSQQEDDQSSADASKADPEADDDEAKRSKQGAEAAAPAPSSASGVSPEVLSSPNLRMLATFLGNEHSAAPSAAGSDAAQVVRQSMLTKREPSGRAAAGAKYYRNQQSERTLPSFDGLAGQQER